jgi:2,4-dienoyl-CoA reductase-like NADH-dependent reductase (Old Yellow Enzyme family)
MSAIVGNTTVRATIHQGNSGVLTIGFDGEGGSSTLFSSILDQAQHQTDLESFRAKVVDHLTKHTEITTIVDTIRNRIFVRSGAVLEKPEINFCKDYTLTEVNTDHGWKMSINKILDPIGISVGLAQPLTLPCGVVLKNRIAKAAMSENLADKHHRPTEGFSTLYSTWAKGGAGLLISGNIMVDRRALGEPRNVVIEQQADNLSELSNWASSCTQNGTALWAQLNHPGKQAPNFINEETVAPSPIGFPPPLDKTFRCPRELTEAEILDIVERFAYAAKILKEAGFTGVQIHGAHGYLVSQFLSPLHNQRTDQWGGTLENRLRFPLAVYRAIRREVGPEFPIGFKLNSADFQRGGFSEDDSLTVAQTLSKEGIDLIEISGGTYEAPAMTGTMKESTRKREAYFLKYCEKISKTVKTPLMLTGGFRSREGMEGALKSRACQVIGLARSLAVEPDISNRLLGDQPVISLVHPITTGCKRLDRIVPLEITWYTQQMRRISNGQPASPHASAWYSILKTLWQYGYQSLFRTRPQ